MLCKAGGAWPVGRVNPLRALRARPWIKSGASGLTRPAGHAEGWPWIAARDPSRRSLGDRRRGWRSDLGGNNAHSEPGNSGGAERRCGDGACFFHSALRIAAGALVVVRGVAPVAGIEPATF